MVHRIKSVTGQVLVKLEQAFSNVTRLRQRLNMTYPALFKCPRVRYQLYDGLCLLDSDQRRVLPAVITVVFVELETGLRPCSSLPTTLPIYFNRDGTGIVSGRGLCGTNVFSIVPGAQCTRRRQYGSGPISGSACRPDTLTIQNRHNGTLLGFELFKGYRIMSHAFDDQGEYGAVLCTRDIDGETALIVFREQSKY